MKYFIGLMMVISASFTQAAVLEVTTSLSKVSAVRVESKWGFISFSNQSQSACSNGRVYVDLDSEYHKISYSTALAAYMSGKSVTIRADDAAAKVFGACRIYDIYVTN
ncbi:hypothetical protein F0267_24665 [Vibrio coralliilyticus]|uniref:Uncharacterized protein n=1 Tax=Vibrio coralliilyticus TaxID=190893 RepID=A0AAN0VZC7_9VIBR|nr:hypothetical protein [Vibrio coralliilyticus]AIW21382.1 hypothetical protein IX92_20445 [Vibrio coralliilyticus]NOH41424.1 hypothetical protein [Vibrio coralliilyticus]